MIEEIHHKLNDLALRSGRLLQSKETRMVHLYYGKKEQDVDQTIPMYENLLFALALCRTKTVDGIQEAKTLLERLLAYQGDNGLFPVYLHEYPFYHDRYIGAHLLPVLYLIDHYFHQVIGLDLKKAIQKLAHATAELVHEMPFALSAKAMGALIALGDKKAEDFPEGKPDWTPKDIGDWLLGLSLAHLPFPKDLDWNSSLHSFIGPWREVQFEKGKLALTLYDLFATSLQGVLPSKFNVPHPACLQAALIFFKPQEVSLKNEPFSCASFSGPYTRGDYPFYMIWGSEGHSLALHAGELKDVKEGKGTLEISLGALPVFDDKEKAREIVLSLSESAHPRLTVNGMPATTFKAGDNLVIQAEGAKIELKFEVKGKGTFLGHLSRGNRPTEWMNAGKNRFNAYDVQLALRSIQRDENVQIILHYRFSPAASGLL